MTTDTWAARHDDAIYVNHDLVSTIVGKPLGYRVSLHSAPKYTFYVNTETGDLAVQMALKVARGGGLRLAGTGATFQKV